MHGYGEQRVKDYLPSSVSVVEKGRLALLFFTLQVPTCSFCIMGQEKESWEGEEKDESKVCICWAFTRESHLLFLSGLQSPAVTKLNVCPHF